MLGILGARVHGEPQIANQHFCQLARLSFCATNHSQACRSRLSILYPPHLSSQQSILTATATSNWHREQGS